MNLIAHMRKEKNDLRVEKTKVLEQLLHAHVAIENCHMNELIDKVESKKRGVPFQSALNCQMVLKYQKEKGEKSRQMLNEEFGGEWFKVIEK